MGTGTPAQITQYLDNISQTPSLTPTAGTMLNDTATGSYTGYFVPGTYSTGTLTGEEPGPNVQSTSTGQYQSYVGGFSTSNTDPTSSNYAAGNYGQLMNAIAGSFSNEVSSQSIESFFNSLTTANPNAQQYVSSGATSSIVPGAFTASAGLVNLNITNTAAGATSSGSSTPTSASSTPYTPPSNFSAFMQDMLTFLQKTTGNPNLSFFTGSQSTTDLTQTPAYQAFLSVFEASTQSSTDWSIIPGFSSTSGTGVVPAQFQNAFTAFLNSFPYAKIQNVSSSGTYNLITSQDFLGEWLNFTAGTSTLQTATQNVQISQSAVTAGNASSTDANQVLLNYQAIYNAFYPNTPPAQFQAFFQNFYNKIMSNPANGGYFLPSQFVGQFYDAVQQQYLQKYEGQSAQINLTQPVASIIWQVLAHIDQMIGVIQQLTVYASQQLNFLSTYQNAYTQLIGTIPGNISTSDPVLGDSGSGGPNPAGTASGLNSTLNNYRTTLSSYRDQVTATSKQVQSFINTLSQASSNSLNQGGALLTLLNTLLQIV